MPAVAVAIVCKTPIAGLCKTRLSPPLRPDECSALSACFIRDLSATISALARAEAVACYAVYTPIGSEDRLRPLLPDGFRLLPQSVGDLGARLFNATAALIGAGHDGAILVNSDSPTLPLSILRDAVRSVRRGDSVVLGPSLDGGYTLVGLAKPHGRLFDEIPWSTPQVHRVTLDRAREIDLPVIPVPQWYDIDDEYTLRLLQAEFAGEPLAFAAPGLIAADAPWTRRFLVKHRARADQDSVVTDLTIISRMSGLSRELAALVTLSGLGLLLFLVTGLALRVHNTINWNLFVLLMVASGLLTVAATKLAAYAPAGLGLLVVISCAVALRGLALSQGPILSDDIYRYVWDGIVQGAGINPYRYVPADPALAALRDSFIFPNINRADYAPTIYPPVAQFFFFLVTRISGSMTGMRLALIGCEVVTVIVLIDLLRRIGKPVMLVTSYAWHPLAVWEIANNGHIDALLVMLVMIGIWLGVCHHRIAAGVAITLGALVKPYAIAALPAFWRLTDWRLPLAVILTAVACYLPYVGAGTGVFGFLFSGYLQEERFATGEGFWLVHAARTLLGDAPRLTAIYIAIAAATLGLLALRSATTPDKSPEQIMSHLAALVLAGLFFLSPNYPWYFLLCVPFVPLGGGTPAWAMSLGAPLLYFVYPDYEARFLLWKGVISGTFLLAVLAITLRQGSNSWSLQGTLGWMR